MPRPDDPWYISVLYFVFKLQVSKGPVGIDYLLGFEALNKSPS